MPLTQHELELRRAAIERIEQGLLPREARETVWAGHGSEQPCSLCDRAIGRADVEYELAEGNGSGLRVVRFHVRCHAIWQLELASRSD